MKGQADEVENDAFEDDDYVMNRMDNVFVLLFSFSPCCSGTSGHVLMGWGWGCVWVWVWMSEAQSHQRTRNKRVLVCIGGGGRGGERTIFGLQLGVGISSALKNLNGHRSMPR